jgi:hypothetical protein
LYFWKYRSQVSGQLSCRLQRHYVTGATNQAGRPRPVPRSDIDGGATFADEVVYPIEFGFDPGIHRTDRRAHHTIREQPGNAGTQPRRQSRAALHAPTIPTGQ